MLFIVRPERIIFFVVFLFVGTCIYQFVNWVMPYLPVIGAIAGSIVGGLFAVWICLVGFLAYKRAKAKRTLGPIFKRFSSSQDGLTLRSGRVVDWAPTLCEMVPQTAPDLVIAIDRFNKVVRIGVPAGDINIDMEMVSDVQHKSEKAGLHKTLELAYQQDGEDLIQLPINFKGDTAQRDRVYAELEEAA